MCHLARPVLKSKMCHLEWNRGSTILRPIFHANACMQMYVCIVGCLLIVKCRVKLHAWHRIHQRLSTTHINARNHTILSGSINKCRGGRTCVPPPHHVGHMKSILTISNSYPIN